MKKVLLLLFLSSLVLFPVMTIDSSPCLEARTENRRSVSAVMLANTSNPQVSEPVKILLTLHNSYYWELSNITFNITFYLPPSDFRILAAKNTTGISYNSTERPVTERLLIGVNISHLAMNATSTFFLIGAIKEEGSFSIEPSQISFQKRRGPIQETGTINCEDIELTVREVGESPPRPPEGEKDMEIYILFVLIGFPPLLLSILTYVGKSKSL